MYVEVDWFFWKDVEMWGVKVQVLELIIKKIESFIHIRVNASKSASLRVY